MNPTLRISFISLFPEVFRGFFDFSLLGKAKDSAKVSFETLNPRSFAEDKHRTVDEPPFGGGEGMVLKVDVLTRTWRSIAGENSHTVFLSPQGKPLTQAKLKELSQKSHLILVCGHYEAVDERFIEQCVDEEVSIGDYVLTGGELPAMVLAEGVVRLLPGVVGNERSLSEESFEEGLLKYPQYTRPREFEGKAVPEILCSGDHGAIAKWRAEQKRLRTQVKRPDLYTRWLQEQGAKKGMQNPPSSDS